MSLSCSIIFLSHSGCDLTVKVEILKSGYFEEMDVRKNGSFQK